MKYLFILMTSVLTFTLVACIGSPKVEENDDVDSLSIELTEESDSIALDDDMCQYCMGTGYMPCPECDGEGFVYDDSEELMGKTWGHPCIFCGGDDVNCYDDDESVTMGTGRVECMYCNN